MGLLQGLLSEYKLAQFRRGSACAAPSRSRRLVLCIAASHDCCCWLTSCGAEYGLFGASTAACCRPSLAWSGHQPSGHAAPHLSTAAHPSVSTDHFQSAKEAVAGGCRLFRLAAGARLARRREQRCLCALLVHGFPFLCLQYAVIYP